MSTCCVALFGAGAFGVAVFASMDDTREGIVAFKRAGLSSLKPIAYKPQPDEQLRVAGVKSDRIEDTERGITARYIIHDTIVQRRGARDFIRIRPYARIVARLATAQPASTDAIPAFNPFKLYANSEPIGTTLEGSGKVDTAVKDDVTVRVVELHGGILPREDGLELRSDEVRRILIGTATDFGPDDTASAMGASLHTASLGTQNRVFASGGAGNMTVIEKSLPEAKIDGNEVRTLAVSRGDTLAEMLGSMGVAAKEAKKIVRSITTVFPAKKLRAGDEVRVRFAANAKDAERLEPIRTSVFNGENHRATVTRNDDGTFVVSDQPITSEEVAALKPSQYPERANIYTSCYHVALNQKLSPQTIKKMIQVHSYDVDFKKLVRSGDSLEMFYELEADDNGRHTKPGEILFTSITVDGEKHGFYRFRTPDDGAVNYYDKNGDSAKKFLMRKPVKGGRFTSGYGYRRHPLLGYRKMHTGTDWAAPWGTPILAAGNGVVERAGRKGGYGKYVLIRHANGYKTAYAHMARYAKGLKPGVKVRQGQVIGEVGSTGLSTGPHLHYEVLINGRHVDPMKIKVPRGRKLAGRLLQAFKAERARIDRLMNRTPVTSRIAAIAD